MGYGNNGTLSMNIQNSFGTSNVDSPYFLPLNGESIALKKPPLMSGEMKGIFEEGASYEGPNVIEGDVEIDMDIVSIGAMCTAVMGPPSTVTSDSLKIHTFEPRTSDFDENIAGTPITIEKYLDDGGSAQVYYDLAGSMLELSVANGEFYKAKMGMMGGKYVRNEKTTPSYPSDNKYTWDQSSFSVGSAAISDIMDLTITLDENLTNKHTLNNSKFPAYTKRAGFRTIRASGTFVFNNQTEYNEFLNQTERSMKISFATSTEVQSGYFESVALELPAFRYETFEPLLTGPGQIEVGFNAHGKYLVTSGTGMRVTLTTTQGTW